MRLNIRQKIISLFLFALFLTVFGCQISDPKAATIRSIPIDLTLERFDEKFHLASPENIPALKSEYPFLFPEKFHDSVWIRRQKDSLQQLLLDNVQARFTTTRSIEEDLELLFKHLKYYFPKMQTPRVIGVINNVDYQSKTVYADSLLIISLDTYLGADHPLYEGIPRYVRQEMDIKFLSSHVAEKFAEKKIPLPKDRTFLSQMIYYGKMIYLKDWVLPDLSDAVKMRFSASQILWAKENEKYIWQYFVEKQLLFSTDQNLSRRFIEPTPFSKFYLEIDNESPGRIGVWMGWQIIKSYMANHADTPIQTLLNLPAQTLFTKSNYKPDR
ncbi:MAG: gliding motility lipoprotein GldB [Flavobacteriia bacterium]|nr:gliding motility lipoprotein GldB [Flavobacteriia bacterium]